MEIGEPQRHETIEPVEDPVPQGEPVPEPEPELEPVPDREEVLV